MMEITCFEVNPFSQNTYLVHNNSEAVLIDAGFYSSAEIAQFFRLMEEKKLELKAILLTHAHIDHVLGINVILKKWEVPVYLHKEDVVLLQQVHQQGQLFGFKVDPILIKTIPIDEQKAFKIGSFECDVFFTPGHAPGHVSFYFSELKTVISGDVLFAGSIGRTDLYKGDAEILAQSIKEKIYTLPDETVVLAGHGPATTVKREKITNPYVRA